MLVDSHTHLNMPHFRDDLDKVIERARTAGIVEMLNLGYDPGSMEETVELADRYGDIYAATGIHPHHAKEWEDGLEKRLKQLMMRRKVLALGEIGLDYYRDLSPRNVQKDVFRKQIGIALYFDKPIIVHCRDAFDDVIDILVSEGADQVGGIFHAFSGGVEEAVKVLKLGFRIGIGGPLTYRNSRLPDVAARLPSQMIVVETDCPYLPPQRYRGKRNEPSYVRYVAEKLAEIRSVDVDDIERATTMNYRRLLHDDHDDSVNIAYGLKNNVYVNVTNTCTNHCVFCDRRRFDNYLYGYNMNLVTDPTPDEMVAAVRESAAGDCREIVFCGYGEPSTRLREILEAAGELKSAGLPIRLNTNGQGNLINGRNIVPELERVFDRVSVSLNAQDAQTYIRLCRPDAGWKAFDSVIDFIRKAAASRMECSVTALDCREVDLDVCRKLIEPIRGAVFRGRKHQIALCEE